MPVLKIYHMYQASFLLILMIMFMCGIFCITTFGVVHGTWHGRDLDYGCIQYKGFF